MNEHDDPRPLYQDVAQHYRAAITLGALAASHKLPSLREMMKVHRISLSTAIQACRYLEREGLVAARPRSGYFVVGRQDPDRNPESWHAEPRGAANFDIHSACVDDILAMARSLESGVDLSMASCAPQIYPSAALRALARTVMREDEDILTSPPRPLGNMTYKAAIARRALSRGIKVSPEEVIVTHGGSECLALALRVVTKPGDTVLLESPTYYGALQLLHALEVNAVELPTNARHGLLIDAVEFALRKLSRATAIVNMPMLHNPLGSTMPNDMREKLVALCGAHDIALIEDDVHADLHPAAPQLKAQKSWDCTGNVIYCGSFNKSLSPGLRLGWMLGGRWRNAIEALKMTQSRSKEELQQQVVARFMDDGSYSRHLERLHTILDRQRKETTALVGNAFPEGTAVHPADGGVLLWVKLPGDVSSRRLFYEALQMGIKIVPGAIFSDSPHFDGYIRLGCGWPISRERVSAVTRLGEICRKLMADPGASSVRAG